MSDFNDNNHFANLHDVRNNGSTLMHHRKPAGNMLWVILFFFAATFGLSACSDVSHAPAPPIPPGALDIATSTLPSGSVGIFYDVTLAPSGGSPPYSWSLSSGSLPNGLTLAPSGRISGTPTTAQITNPTFRLQDSAVPTAAVVTKQLPMSITAVPQPSITTPSPLPNGIVSQPYPSTTLTAVGGTPPYTWSATVTPALPSGLTFDAVTATISGTPTVITTNVTHTFSVTDSFFPTPQTVSKGLALTVSPAPLPLTITTPSPLPGGTITQFYSTPLTAIGGTPPLTWSLASGSPALPNGLTLNSTTGVLSGTPTTAVAVSPIFRVQDSASSPQQSNQKTLSITIGVPAAPSITTLSLPNGSFNNSYNQTLTVTGGIAPFTWGVIAGGLPTGLTLNSSNGTISGTATATGTFNFTVRVTDAIPQFDTQTLSITITAPAAPAITAPSSLPIGTVNQTYPNTTLTASGGTAPLTWDPVVNPTLPNGLSWDAATHTISGIPLNGSQGTASHTFTVRDSTNPVLTGTRTYSLTVNLPTPPNITTTSASLLPNGTVNAFYSRTLTATGGTAPLTWSIPSGALPTGITLNPTTGVISGTPTVASTFPFTVQVTDALSQTDPTPPLLSITINLPAPPNITTTSTSLLPNGTVGAPYSRTLAATGGTAPLTWSILSGALPTGVTLNPTTGVISGIPTVANAFPFTPQVTDVFSQTDTTPPLLSITIDAAPIPLTIMDTSPLPAAQVGLPYSTTLTAAGGTPPYSNWGVTPPLPNFLTLNPSTGEIAGTPDVGTDGTVSYSFSVQDSTLLSVPKTLSLTINP